MSRYVGGNCIGHTKSLLRQNAMRCAVALRLEALTYHEMVLPRLQGGYSRRCLELKMFSELQKWSQ